MIYRKIMKFKQDTDLEAIAKNLVIGYNMAVLDSENKIVEFWCSDSVDLKPIEQQSDFNKLNLQKEVANNKDKELLNHAKSPIKIGEIKKNAVTVDSG